MRKIVEFTHPGREYIPLSRKRDDNVLFTKSDRSEGIRFWNQLSSHKRKFIKIKSSYIDSLNDKHLKKSQITFWGEWEAQSKFKKTPNTSDKDLPFYIHIPCLDESEILLSAHNTDPFVFGENFWYTNCKQWRNKFLRKLSNYSIILFGTERANGFNLDTVFVVKESFSQNEVLNISKDLPKQLKDTNLMVNDLMIDEDKDFNRFYKGVNFYDNKEFFSYVPCKPYNSLSESHGRPIISWEDFKLQKPGARTVCTPILKDKYVENSLPIEEAKNYWEKITNECIKQGFSLGFDLELPPLINQKYDDIKFNL